MAGAGIDGVGGGELRQLPEARRDRLGRHRLGVGGIAVDLVGQGLVVTIPVGLEGQRHDTGVDGVGGHLVRTALVLRTHLVGSDVATSETHQTLLAGAVDGRELAAVGDVVAIALNGPRGLIHPGVRTRGEGRVEVEVGGSRLALVVGVVASRVGAHRPGGVVREGDAVVVLRRGIREPADVGAVVGVAGDVDDVAGRQDVIGIPVTVRQEGELAGGPVRPEHPLDIGLTARLGEPHAVQAPLRVGAQAHDGPVGVGIAHHRVDLVVAQRAVILQDRQAVAGVVRGVDRRESAADRHTVAVRGGGECPNREVVDVGREVRQLVRLQVERGDAVAGRRVGLGEGAADVESRTVGGEGHSLDRGIGLQAQ